jgi:alpha-mannosidase
MRPSTQRLRRALLDLGPAMYRAAVPLDHFRMLPVGPGMPPGELPIPSRHEAGWRPIAVGDLWGGRDQNAWFRATVRVPGEWQAALDGGASLALRLVLGYGTDFGWPEGLLYVNGSLRQGINRHHPDVLLRSDDAAAGRLDLAVRAWSGMHPVDHRIEVADLALLDRECEALFHLMAMGAEAVEALAEDDPLTYRLSDALEAAYDTLDLRDPASPAYAASARTALAALRTRLAALHEEYGRLRGPEVVAVGHGHLDVAWLWQTRHTREKTARTFGISLALMELYPEYVFLHTTPQVYAWLKEDYPDLYAAVRKRVAEGRFEAAGALWLECDCNLVSGEALVRQVLYGQRFLREELGRECDVLWLPDAFGYSAALPQIMLKSGLRAFMTTKMSWSETNRLPSDTFRWRGLDGSEVLAHFITTPSLAPTPPLDRTDTYNGELTVPHVLGLWQHYRDKALNDELLLAFGFGDGGAGPNRQQLEQARAIQTLPGLPALRFGRAEEYFARLRDRLWCEPLLPVWDGELYLEYHRGTYTTQGWLKRAHRQCEARLLQAELLDAWRWATDPNSAPDARPDLDDAWRTLLLHEFHDILPGSSIGEVYDDARAALGALAEELEARITDDLTALAGQIRAPDGAWLIFNPSPWRRHELVALPSEAGTTRLWTLEGDEAKGTLETQTVEQDGARQLMVSVPAVPGLGYALVVPATESVETSHRREPAMAGPGHLENALFRLEVDERGEVSSLVDKRVPGRRELVPVGSTINQLQLFDDRPRNFDAWDIDAGYERKPHAWDGVSVEAVEHGPLRATLRITRRMRASTVEQRVSLYRDLPRIDFTTRIDWHEQHVVLKAAFPLDLRTTQATFETAFGAIARPSHQNTSWDQARFEVPAHRWADLSEADYGVSLLNDGRYGHDVRDHVLRLTLLRSPTSPDPTADQGVHELTYSLFPHLGDWRPGGTVREAYALNRPVRVVPLPRTSGERAAKTDMRVATFVRAEPENVVVEAIKRAAVGDNLIVRIFEAHGARVRAQIQVAMPVLSVTESDLLEQPLTADSSPAYEDWLASRVASHDAPVLDTDGWSCELRPFEVRTFRVTLNAAETGSHRG